MQNKPETLPFKPEGIPAAVKAVDRWLLWRYELRKGKWVKVPRTIEGKYGQTDNPHTWSSFAAAHQALKTDSSYDGLGLVIPPGIVGVDLDDCIGTEGLTEEAKMLIAMLPSYCEKSPSGTGVKLLVAGNLSDKLAKTNHSKGVELYDGSSTSRYFAITGHSIGPSTITGQRESLFAIQTMITEPIREITTDRDAETVSRAIEFLANIKTDRADNYDDWLKVGMALSWCDRSDEMLDKWIEWSSSSEKFDEDACIAKWESFKREDGRLLTLSYLERLAKEDGYDPGKYTTASVRGCDLLSKTITRDYLIEDFMVRGEPMIIGGASKSLKTSIALDIALSIATGTKFMDRFEVKEPRSVMFLSGESGESTLQDSLRLMAESKGIEFSEINRLEIGFKLPKLDDLKCVDDLIEELKRKQIDILFVDPLYRSLRIGDAASNVYAMGAQLELIAERINKSGITAVLLHHFRKQGKTHSESPELEDLSQSGVAEFGRQFLLLKRREVYQWDGKHELWFNWGGSAGHQGEMMLSAYTGTRQLGLTWRTTLRTQADWKALEAERKQVEREEKVGSLRERVLDLIGENPGIKSTEIVTQLKAGRSETKALLESLEYEMEIHFQPGDKNSKRWYLNESE